MLVCKRWSKQIGDQHRAKMFPLPSVLWLVRNVTTKLAMIDNVVRVIERPDKSLQKGVAFCC